VAPSGPSSPPLSAPGLIGPNSLLNPPATFGASKRRAPKRPYSHVQLEVDLEPGPAGAARPGWVDRLEAVLSEQKIVEGSDLLRLAASALHAFAVEGFRQVDHWEVDPGGWLPLGTTSAVRGEPEPLGTLLREIDREHRDSIARARALSFRLSRPGGNRADVVVRRVHRRRRHALTIDLHGRWESNQVQALVGALQARLEVRTVTRTRYRYA
jgi:hypothetical protein